MDYNYVNILDTVFSLKVDEYCHECLIRHLTGFVSATLIPFVLILQALQCILILLT